MLPHLCWPVLCTPQTPTHEDELPQDEERRYDRGREVKLQEQARKRKKNSKNKKKNKKKKSMQDMEGMEPEVPPDAGGDGQPDEDVPDDCDGVGDCAPRHACTVWNVEAVQGHTQDECEQHHLSQQSCYDRDREGELERTIPANIPPYDAQRCSKMGCEGLLHNCGVDAPHRDFPHFRESYPEATGDTMKAVLQKIKQMTHQVSG